MRKKSISSVEIESSGMSRIRSRNLHPLISPPNVDDNHYEINDSQFPSTTMSNVSLQSKEIFKFRGHKGKCSVNIKLLEDIKPIEEHKIKNTKKLNTLEVCRKEFDKIIEKDKKYGPVLKCIKEMYEKHLEPQYRNNVDNEIKISKENHVNEKTGILKKTLSKSRSNNFLIKTKSIKLPLKIFPKKDSGSTLDTLVTSPRSNIPELSLLNVPKADFHQEFMENYDNFSESWRQLAKGINK